MTDFDRIKEQAEELGFFDSRELAHHLAYIIEDSLRKERVFGFTDKERGPALQEGYIEGLCTVLSLIGYGINIDDFGRVTLTD